MSKDYVRPDGRLKNQLREFKVEVGVLDRSEGSAKVNLGNNMAMASVFGPREMHPKRLSRSDRAIVRVNYRMATFSVDGYKRAVPSRREKEISKVLSEAFQSVVLVKNWPRSVVDVHVEIFQSDGGTRTAAALAITAALADAGIPMRDLTGGIASGIYEDQVCLDLTGLEDMKGSGDMPILYSPAVDEISLFQLDGLFTYEQFKEAYESSLTGIKGMVEVIRDALKEKYVKIREEFGVDDEDVSSDDDISEEEVRLDEDESSDEDMSDETFEKPSFSAVIAQVDEKSETKKEEKVDKKSETKKEEKVNEKPKKKKKKSKKSKKSSTELPDVDDEDDSWFTKPEEKDKEEN
ncbi:MAG: hypothetical protein ACPHNX_02995 [Candidatus Kariarchaeum pelagius]